MNETLYEAQLKLKAAFAGKSLSEFTSMNDKEGKYVITLSPKAAKLFVAWDCGIPAANAMKKEDSVILKFRRLSKARRYASHIREIVSYQTGRLRIPARDPGVRTSFE